MDERETSQGENFPQLPGPLGRLEGGTTNRQPDP